ncbi:MAG: carboxyl transferase domain-containing protein [Parvibaculum sp.]
MGFKKLLIANRGEIAVRIARAAGEVGLATVAIYASDDQQSGHVTAADEAKALTGTGATAYLNIAEIIETAQGSGCDAIHPGYGFLSENVEFANACAAAGLTFVGPSPNALSLFGDKAAARALAAKLGVALLPGTNKETTLEEVHAFFDMLEPGAAIMIKALAGGGGRGMRPVTTKDEIDEAYARCQSEAKSAFGSEALYVEQLIQKARHIEIQIVGDGTDIIHLGERECSLQRRRQKLMEIAPSPSLTEELRSELSNAAIALGKAASYNNIGTFEFLVNDETGQYAFMEANPRLQVEHTVTEEVTGVDLVKTQLQIAAGAKLGELGLSATPAARGFAVQYRINMERMTVDGETVPTGGLIQSFNMPSGPGIRVDTFGYAGYVTSPHYDSLLVKLIVHSPSPNYKDVVARARRALGELHVGGIGTNANVFRNLLDLPSCQSNDITTNFMSENAALLAKTNEGKMTGRQTQANQSSDITAQAISAPPGTIPLKSHLQGRVVSIDAAEGASIAKGQQIAVLEAMKMEHIILASASGLVQKVAVQANDTVFEGAPLLFIEEREVDTSELVDRDKVDLDRIRPDLAEVMERHAIGLDHRRPDAVARRRTRNQRTARENIADLCDDGTFIEYGALALAAQRRRRSMEDLIKMSPADGMITGVGAVNGANFGDEAARAMIMSYDFTVFAGTQGAMNHKKTDRMLELAHQWNLPLILFGEGGGGRPGDTDTAGVAGLDVTTFKKFAELSGKVPTISIVSGRCFAGNAALVGCSDVIIATADSNIGMGGPAMIEGGGLGVYRPEDIGPINVQTKNGVVDIAVADEEEAVAAAKKYLSYFQGNLKTWEVADQRELRHLIPENRLRAYDVRTVINTLADKKSVLELRKDFGIGILTCLVRVEGRPMGLIANNPFHLGGAIDADAADKTARFMQLCEAFNLPILSLCDTPGFMVGPDVEATAQVRHVSRMFVTAANLSIPFFTIVLRKGYGLGAQAMTGGTFRAPFFNIAWPTGEFGGMGLEGAVQLGYRREMEAIEDEVERKAFYDKMVARYYENGKAINMASFLEIDGVIDPFETRHWVVRGLKSIPPKQAGTDHGRSFIDTW